MLCIQNNNTDPYFNLATEEFLLKNVKEDCFMLWRNKPSIIVGKHQNTLAEINIDFVKKENIDVVRRLSGGGTVFHDLGNLNFTFIQSSKDENNLVDFKKYTKPIVEVLQKLGVDAKFEGRNDIMINGRKVSGNAEHVLKNRVLHHGTLLFSSAISDLSQALKVNPLKYQDKGVKSVRSRVTNIKEHLSAKMSVIEFRDTIQQYVMQLDGNAKLYYLSNEDTNQINQLVKEKYATWDWNFGYSPKYTFRKTGDMKSGNLDIEINVERGIIEGVEIRSAFIKTNDIDLLEKRLLGIKHEEKSIRNTLQDLVSGDFFYTVSFDEFIAAMF